MQIESLDHVVLTVADVAGTTDFYTRVLGLRHVEMQGRHALHFGRQKINLHQAGHEFEPKAAYPTTGAGDLCFITRAAPDTIAAHLAACHVTIEEGPVARTGAQGAMTSFYIRDPDRNLIEIATYDKAEPDGDPTA